MAGLADIYVDEDKVAMCKFLSQVDTYTERKHNDPVVVETCETLSRNGLRLPGDLVNIVPREITHVKDAMQRGFIARAISKSEADFMRSAVPARADRSEGLNTLMNAMRKDSQHVHIDLDAELKRMGFGDWHHALRPDGEKVDALATQAQKLRNKGIQDPFIFSELKNFLPCWSGAQPESDASSDEEPSHKYDKARAKRSSKTQNLSLLQWVSAFDRYAIAAAATNQWPLHASMKHKDNCLRIANEAGPTRKHWLALVYDELCRKEWARRAYCEPDFDIAAECARIDTDLRDRAEHVYDNKVREFKSTGGFPPRGASHNNYGKGGVSNGGRNGGYQNFGGNQRSKFDKKHGDDQRDNNDQQGACKRARKGTGKKW